MSERRPGRSGLLVYRFPLPQTVRLSAQLSDSQNEYALRVRVRCTTPRADALNGMAKQFCFYVASAPAL
jgi:hypothetical protein